MRWSPHVTVAAVIEDDGRFLLVKELIDNEVVYNQPAGHLENNETLTDAIMREVLEETAYAFKPTSVIGMYRMRINEKDTTYLRICFAGDILSHNPSRELDKEIIEATWLSYNELASMSDSLRSPLVMTCIDHYLEGQRFDMDILKDIGNV